ncbi:cofactor assembly of complex C [Prunus dulcis]|uniref:Cofactor assembly of complex C n=1 Tax=Prunus dulcis TaxID=3755 RepID=A0A4Y1QQJ8_PRUDU|nr:cofactor assembly of complex C [Prunus dulcis]
MHSNLPHICFLSYCGNTLHGMGIFVRCDVLPVSCIVYDGRCILQIGFAAESSNGDGKAEFVSTCQGLCISSVEVFQLFYHVTSELDFHQMFDNLETTCFFRELFGKLYLYPGKSELPFLPSIHTAVILQPLGDKGITIIGGDTVRGFTSADQAWISLIGEKLDSTLAKYVDNPPVVVQDPVFKIRKQQI